MSVLLCPPCIARFKADREITMVPEGQALTVIICHDCVKKNRWSRFEFKPYGMMAAPTAGGPLTAILERPAETVVVASTHMEC